MGTAIVLLGTIAAGMAGTAALYRVVQNFQPGKQKIKRDYEAMSEEIRDMEKDLVPLKSEELELLSTNQTDTSRKKRLAVKAKGVFTSIYQEPMIAWASRNYLGGDKNALVLVKTARHEFLLRVRKKQTDISVDSKTGLILHADGRLTNPRGKKVLGYIRSLEGNTRSIYVDRREVASIQVIPETSSPQPRVFNFIAENMSANEKMLLLAMLVTYLTDPE
ncbi:MAG: hypothetical protein GYB31_01265 [Bacteroidetes bacterium]|nr:hypothetical protein [Bacteroidota bacterium]